MISLYDGPSQPVYETDNISLSVSIHTSQCVFWEEEQEVWDSMGCKVGHHFKPLTQYIYYMNFSYTLFIGLIRLALLCIWYIF